MNREKFEHQSSAKLQRAVAHARQIRNLLRQLEKDLVDKKEKIDHFQSVFADLQKQLIEIQAIMYSKGTT